MPSASSVGCWSKAASFEVQPESTLFQCKVRRVISLSMPAASAGCRSASAAPVSLQTHLVTAGANSFKLKNFLVPRATELAFQKLFTFLPLPWKLSVDFM